MKTDLNFFLAIILLLIIACFGNKKRITKEQFAEEYGISRHILNKWVVFFQPDIPIREWKRKRYLTPMEAIYLKASFGDDLKMVLNKAQIAAYGYSNYKTVAKVVRRKTLASTLTNEAWDSCSCFPPDITEQILKHLG